MRQRSERESLGTGVGRSIVDMLKRCTSPGRRFQLWRVRDPARIQRASRARRELVTSLEVVLQARRVEAVADCPLQAAGMAPRLGVQGAGAWQRTRAA